MNPIVGIIMGSSSDLPIMQEAARFLEAHSIAYELDVVSAHRTPEKMIAYGKTARSRGLQVIIAGAGGAAHLPGMIAATTTLPVIGVPIKSSNSIEGIDSLLSIVQMPSGVPVATVAVNGAQNAGVLAAQIISLQRADVQQSLEKHKQQLQAKTEKMSLEVTSPSPTVP